MCVGLEILMREARMSEVCGSTFGCLGLMLGCVRLERRAFGVRNSEVCGSIVGGV